MIPLKLMAPDTMRSFSTGRTLSTLLDAGTRKQQRMARILERMGGINNHRIFSFIIDNSGFPYVSEMYSGAATCSRVFHRYE
jgi:hypothetical protein